MSIKYVVVGSFDVGCIWIIYQNDYLKYGSNK